MTMIKKKFTSIDDGINNMLDAAAYDYSKGGYTHRTSDEFRAKFMVKVGQKYIKIGRVSDHSSGKMGQVWAFVVNTDDDDSSVNNKDKVDGTEEIYPLLYDLFLSVKRASNLSLIHI